MPIYDSRKYIDLILKASAKWATLEPFAKQIEAGDYGRVDPDTGEFEHHGNIYTNPDIIHRIPELATDICAPRVSDEIEKLIIATETTRDMAMDVNPVVNAGSVVQASLEVQISFKRGTRGAFLAMYRPKSMDLPKDVLLHKLHNLKALKGMCLVTSVTCCPAYSLYLSDRSAENVHVALAGSVPVVSAPGLFAGGNVGQGWMSDRKTGLYQEGFDPDGRHKYIPLFSLKQMRNRGRIWTLFRDGSGQQKTVDELWMDAVAPWDSLDDDGAEEEFFDAINSD